MTYADRIPLRPAATFREARAAGIFAPEPTRPTPTAGPDAIDLVERHLLAAADYHGPANARRADAHRIVDALTGDGSWTLDGRVHDLEVERDDLRIQLRRERAETAAMVRDRDAALDERDEARRELLVQLDETDKARHDALMVATEQDDTAPSPGSGPDRAQELPAWVLDLVQGLADYEDEHPPLYRQLDESQYGRWVCPGSLLDLVPADVRARAGRRDARCNPANNPAKEG